MFIIENWMFDLGLSYGSIVIFAYAYNCIKSSGWNSKEISSIELAKIMRKQFQNINTALNNLCNLGLLQKMGYSSHNCSIYSLTPKVFEVSKETPVVYQNTDKDYSEDIKKVMDKFHSVLGIDLYPIEQIEQYAIPLLAAGQTADNLCAVIECKAREWRDNTEMCQFIRPQTLFGNKYDQYLQYSKLMSTFKSDIDVSLVYSLYEHLGLNPPEKLTEWCIKTFRENPDLNVSSLAMAIHDMYLDLKKDNSKEWLQKKLESTNKLTELLPKYKDSGIMFQDMAEDISHLAI